MRITGYLSTANAKNNTAALNHEMLVFEEIMTIPDSARIADNLKNIPGIEKALETPIIDVDQSKVVTVMERVIFSLEKSVPTGCKDSMVVQIMTGK